MITRRLCAEHGDHVFLDVKSLFRDEPSALAMFLNATQESAGWMRHDVNVGKIKSTNQISGSTHMPTYFNLLKLVTFELLLSICFNLASFEL